MEIELTKFPNTRFFLDNADKEIYNGMADEDLKKTGVNCARLIIAMSEDGIDLNEIMFWCDKYFNYLHPEDKKFSLIRD